MATNFSFEDASVPSTFSFEEAGVKQNKGIIGDIGTGIKRGVEQIPGMITGVLDIPPALAFGTRPFTKIAEAAGRATGLEPGKWADTATAEYSPGHQQAQADIDAVWKDPNAGALDVAKAYVTNPGYTASTVAESLPSMVTGAGVGATALRAGRVAGVGAGALERTVGADLAVPVAGGIGEGSVQAGQQMDQFKGTDQRKNAIAAIGSGVIDGIIGAGAGRLANKMGLETAETALIKDFDGSLKSQLSLGKRVAGGALSEGILQELPQSAQEQVWQNYADSKPLWEGVARQAVEGALAGFVMGGVANVRGGQAAPVVPPVVPGGQAAPVVPPVVPGGQAAPVVPPVVPPAPPAGTGIGQMNEFADLVDAEKLDVATRRQLLIDQQAAAAQMRALQQDSALESTDARVLAAQQDTTRAGRMALIDAAGSISSDVDVERLLGAFATNFPNEPNLRPEEKAILAKRQSVRQAKYDDTPPPPNEMDVYAPAKQPAIAPVADHIAMLRTMAAKPGNRVTPDGIRDRNGVMRRRFAEGEYDRVTAPVITPDGTPLALGQGMMQDVAVGAVASGAAHAQAGTVTPEQQVTQQKQHLTRVKQQDDATRIDAKAALDAKKATFAEQKLDEQIADHAKKRAEAADVAKPTPPVTPVAAAKPAPVAAQPAVPPVGTTAPFTQHYDVLSTRAKDVRNTIQGKPVSDANYEKILKAAREAVKTGTGDAAYFKRQAAQFSATKYPEIRAALMGLHDALGGTVPVVSTTPEQRTARAELMAQAKAAGVPKAQFMKTDTLAAAVAEYEGVADVGELSDTEQAQYDAAINQANAMLDESDVIDATERIFKEHTNDADAMRALTKYFEGKIDETVAGKGKTEISAGIGKTGDVAQAEDPAIRKLKQAETYQATSSRLTKLANTHGVGGKATVEYLGKLKDMAASDHENASMAAEILDAFEQRIANFEQKAKPLNMAGETRPTRVTKPTPAFTTLPPMSRDKFNAAFEAKDVAKMSEMLDPANRSMRAEFEARTGVKLPKTMGGTDAAIAQWVDTGGVPVDASLDTAGRFKKTTFKPAEGNAGDNPEMSGWSHGGLIVHKALGHFLRGLQYAISLESNGLSVISGFKSLESAKIAAIRLARSGPMADLKSIDDVGKPEFKNFKDLALAIRRAGNDPLAEPQVTERTGPNDVTTPPRPIDTTHAGYNIYSGKSNLGDYFGVQTEDNKQAGKAQGFGDTQYTTLAEAKLAAERQAERVVQDAERAKVADAATAAREATVANNRKLSLTERKANAVLDKPANYSNFGLGNTTRREAMDRAVEQGRAIVERPEEDTAAKKRDREHVDKNWSRLPTGNINYPGVKEYYEAKDRLAADAYTKPNYRVYEGREASGRFISITKTEHDYAQGLIAAQPAAAVGADEFATTAPLASVSATATLSGKTVADYATLARDANLRLRNGYRVAIVQSVKDLPTNARLLPKTEGMYISGKTAYIVADTIHTPERAREVIQHELAHMAAEQVLTSAEYTKAVAAVIRMHQMGNANMRRLGAIVDKTQPGLDAETRAKEILAVAVEDGTYQQSGVLSRLVADIVAAFKRIAQAMGWSQGGTMSEADVWSAMRGAMAGLEQVQAIEVGKDALGDAFGLYLDGKTYVRSDLPAAVKRFVTAHEAHHVKQTDAFRANHPLLSEISASLFPGFRDPIGLLATISATLTPARIKMYAGLLGINGGTPTGINYDLITAASVERVVSGAPALASVAAATTPTTRASLAPETWMQKEQRKWQDRMNRWKIAQTVTEANLGTVLNERANVYEAETAMHGKISSQIQDFREQFEKPLIDKTAAAGFNMDQIAGYLEVMHAKEANAAIQKLHNDPTATAFGVTDAEAAAELAHFNAQPNAAEFRKIAEQWRGISDGTLNMLVAGGIATQEQSDTYHAAYKNYIPVRGGEEDGTQSRVGGQRLGGKIKRRLGHTARDEHIIENILKAREQAIKTIERNNVRAVMANFLMVAANPEIGTVGKPVRHQVLRDNKSYAVEYQDVPVAVFSTLNGAKDFMRTEILTHKRDKKDFKINTHHDPLVAMMASPMLADNEVNVYVNGAEVRLQLNDEILARAATGLGTEQLGTLLSAARQFNTYLSKAYTGWNAEFALVNPIRDFTAGLINLTGDYGVSVATKIAGNYGKAVKELIKGRKDPKLSKWLSEYRADGGSTGAAYLSDLERIGADTTAAYHEALGARETYALVREQEIAAGRTERQANITALRKAGIAGAESIPVIGHFLKLMERINSVTENALRLATYITLRESIDPNTGVAYTGQKAANASKNSTVNFNRKGELTAQASALYLFFNPNVQGTARTMQTLFTSKHKTQAQILTGVMAMAAFTLAEMARGGDDDDELAWNAISDSVKNRNLIVKFGDIQLTLPIPYGYGYMLSLGNAFSDMAHGKKASKIALNMASGMMDNFSPVGNPVDDSGKFVPFQMMPTIPKMALSPEVNQGAFAKPIMPTKFSEAKPDSQTMWRGTKGSIYDSITSSLNDATGGNKYQAGGIDMSPETLKFWVNSLTGGAGRFLADSVNLPIMLAQGATPDIRDVPIVRKFVREQSISDIRSQFWQSAGEAGVRADEYRAARKGGDVETARSILVENPGVLAMAKQADAFAKMAKAKRDLVDKIRQDDTLSLDDKRTQMKEIEQREQKIYTQFLQRWAS